MAIGHLNGGTKLDIAAVTQNNDKLHVLVGNGNGTFDYVNNPTFAFPLPGLNARPVATAIADLNLDGLPDVVVVNHGIWENPGNPSKVYVLINGLQVTGP